MNKKPKIALIFGTRPEIIKLSPLIRLFEKRHVNYITIHSGQHYSYEMDRVFFEELELPEPSFGLNIQSTDALHQATHTGRMLMSIEKILLSEKPDIVLVQGDTNTVLAGALTVSKFLTTTQFTHLEMKIGHIEAGLRSYDRRMPEEINRVVADHLSNYLFVPTAHSKRILLEEKIPRSRIFVTGNTIVDAVTQNRKIAERKSKILRKFRVKKDGYFLMTLHRQENVDDKRCLKRIVEGITRLTQIYGQVIIFPMHPRTKKQLETFNIKLPSAVLTMDPIGYLDFLTLEANAGLILTDSGGLQEEAMILRVPCVTLRRSTERPETVKSGGNVLAGDDPKRIVACAKHMLKQKRTWKNALGDGRTSERILRIIRK